MSSYAEFKKKSLEDPEVRTAYDELQPEYDIIQEMIDASKSVSSIYPSGVAIQAI